MWLWKLRCDCWQACLSFEVRIWLPEHKCVCKNSDHAFDCWTLSLTIGSLTSLWNIGIGCGVAHVDHQNAVLIVRNPFWRSNNRVSLLSTQCHCLDSNVIVDSLIRLLQSQFDSYKSNLTADHSMWHLQGKCWLSVGRLGHCNTQWGLCMTGWLRNGGARWPWRLQIGKSGLPCSTGDSDGSAQPLFI